MSPDWSRLVHYCAQAVGSAVSRVPGQQATRNLRKIFKRCERRGEDFLEAAMALDIRLTPEIWAGYLGMLCSLWKDTDIAPHLGILRSALAATRNPDGAQDFELLNRAVLVLEALTQIPAEPEDDTRKLDFLRLLLPLIEAVDDLGDFERAYDIAAVGLDMGPAHGEVVEQIARVAAASASESGRMPQIAVSQAALAVAVAEAGDDAPERRIEAFEAAERALEALVFCEADIRELVIAELNPLCESFGYLRCLQIPLLSYLPAERRTDEFNELLGAGSWPPRIDHTSGIESWVAGIGQGPASAWETEIDRHRFALEPAHVPDLHGLASGPAGAWLRRPLARRAVPQDRSFVLETDFAPQLLRVIESTTQEFCFLSQIGLALTALRLALFDNELTLWSSLDPDVSPAPRIAREGVAPIVDGNAVGLIRAELRLELVEKSRLIEDVWLAWFEGIALYAAGATDPELDANGDSPIGEALRSLVDFLPKQDDTQADVQAGTEKTIADFEARWHAAVREFGSAHFAGQVRDDAYATRFAGYLAVRSVITSWEATVGHPMLAADAFDLLLHATRFGTEAAVPALTLPAAAFGDEAVRLQAEWVRTIASISQLEIENFIKRSRAGGTGQSFFWDGGRLKPSTADAATLDQREIATRSRLLDEALRAPVAGAPEIDASADAAEALTRDAARVLESGQARKLKAGIVPNMLTLMDQLLAGGSLLEIGRSAARFHLHARAGDEHAHLALYLRTSEKLAATGEPGGEMLIWRLTPDNAALLEKRYTEKAMPRLGVARLIDLAGLAAPGTSGACHLFALHSGQWLHIQGTTPATQKLLLEDPQRLARLTEIVRYRVAPSPVQRAERELVAPGWLAVAGTRRWLDRSVRWSFEGAAINAGAWAAGLAGRCDEMLDCDRPRRQLQFAVRLLGDIWSDADAAAAIGRGFESLTESAPASRQAVLDWLYATGCGEGSAEEAVAGFAATAGSGAAAGDSAANTAATPAAGALPFVDAGTDGPVVRPVADL